MDGFLHFSEEAMGGAMRGPTPPHQPSASGRGQGQHQRQHHGGGRGGGGDRGGGRGRGPGGLKLNVGGEEAKAGAGGPAGHVSFSHDQLGTPSASLVGNRAKMR